VPSKRGVTAACRGGNGGQRRVRVWPRM
ncbi:MAG: hypothetical protein, partial [Olavius algarvensis Gamma 1 endosymbiont]